MAKLLKLRRGTTSQHSSFTGAEGEVTVDTDKDTVVVHDNSTAGGRPLLREDLNNMPASGVTAGTYGSSSAIPAITVDAKGRVTSATTNAIDSTSITNGTSNVSVAASGNITATRAGTTRLTVNSTGIDVTGTVTCDGFTSDGASQINVSNGCLTLRDSDSTGDAAVNFVRGQDSGGDQKWYVGDINGNADMYLWNQQNGYVYIGANNSTVLAVQNNNVVRPGANNTVDLGTSSYQFKDAYFDGTVYCDGLESEGQVTITSGTGVLKIQDNNSTGNAAENYIYGANSDNSTRWYLGQSSSNNQDLYVQNQAAANIRFGTNGSARAFFTSAGHFIPNGGNTYDLGDTGNRWRNVYTNDLNLSNEGSSNDVDGTWGSWTIQEGEDDLFLLNRRNGKKYKFNLSEVN